MGLFLFLLSLSLILIIVVAYALIYGITPTPTSFLVQKNLLEIIPKTVQGNIFELGSGWGSLAFALAKRFPQCNIYAYEVSPIPWLVSHVFYLSAKTTKLKIIRKDFFKVSLQDAHLVVCYLYPGAMQALKEKFDRELLPGAWVISHTFAIPGWTPLKVQRVNDLYQTPIYLYQKSVPSNLSKAG